MSTDLKALLQRIKADEMSDVDALAELNALQSARPERQQRTRRETGLALPEGFIERDQLPDVFRATAQHYSLSQEFSHINTDSVIAGLETHGWKVHVGKGSLTGTQVKRRGAVGREQSTAPHGVTLRHPEQMERGLAVGDMFVQLNIRNGADGTTPFIGGLGPFVLVCSNGMVSQRGGFSIRIKHRGVTTDQVVETMLKLSANADIMLDQYRIMNSVTLSDVQALAFAERCLKYRWALEVENDRHQTIANPGLPNPRVLLGSLYSAQNEPTMANVLNNVQRNLLGAIDIPSPVSVRSKSGMRSSPAPTGLAKVWNINQGVDFEAWEFMNQEFPEVEMPIPTTVYEPNYTVLS